MTGKILYQSCNESLCVFRKENFEFILKDGFESKAKLVIDDVSEAKSNELILDLKEEYRLNQNSIRKDYEFYQSSSWFSWDYCSVTHVFSDDTDYSFIFYESEQLKKAGCFQIIYVWIFIVLIYLLLSLPFHF